MLCLVFQSIQCKLSIFFFWTAKMMFSEPHRGSASFVHKSWNRVRWHIRVCLARAQCLFCKHTIQSCFRFQNYVTMASNYVNSCILYSILIIIRILLEELYRRQKVLRIIVANSQTLHKDFSYVFFNVLHIHMSPSGLPANGPRQGWHHRQERPSRHV